MRLFLVPITLAALLLAGAPALAQGLPTDRNAPAYLLDYWRGHAAGSTLGIDASETSPGYSADAPALYVHNIYGAKIPPAQAELLKRRLMVAYQALMAQPSLADIHGSSLQVAINITRTPTDGEPVINASLTFIAKPITRGDPKTFALKGRYVTPGGEGPVLEVILNPYGYVAGSNLRPGPIAGRAMALNAGTTMGLLVTDAPAGPWDGHASADAFAADESWIGRPGVHPLLVRVAGSRQHHEEIGRGRTPPTDGLARLIAAAYMVDWQAVQAQMATLR